ncbi:MAG: hypothetical protein WA666_13660 [Nitrospirota bacterium]
MRLRTTLLALFIFSFVFSGLAYADDIDSRLKAMEDTLKGQQEQIQEQQKVINELKEELSAIKAAPAAIQVANTPMSTPATEAPVAAASESSPAAASPEANAPKTSGVQEQVQELSDKVNDIAEAQRKVLPSEFNPSIGLVGETIFSYRNRPSSQTGSARPGGFDAFQRSVELNLAGSVDPFASAYVVANATADAATGESTFGVEEAALQTETLPYNLTLKAGRFFGEFGRLGYIHDHELPFVNRPLVLAEYIGGESRTDGAQINWLLPLERYVSLTVGAGNQFGGDNPPNDVGEFRHLDGWNYFGRLSSDFDVTPDISFEPGISGLWNPETNGQWASPGNVNPPFPTVGGNTFTERERRLYGADLTFNYKPLRNNQFQSLVWGTEVLYSDNRYDVGPSGGPVLSTKNVGSTGLYSYATYKWSREWSAGFLYEWLENMVDKHDKTSAYSPYITWATSHWDQLRLQYTYTDHNAESGLRPDHAVYLQWAWIIGSHSHGWQQR